MLEPIVYIAAYTKKTVITRFPELKYSFKCRFRRWRSWVFVYVGMQTIEAIVGNVGTYCVHSGIHKKKTVITRFPELRYSF